MFQGQKPTPRNTVINANNANNANNVNNVNNVKYAINEKNVPPAPLATL